MNNTSFTLPPETQTAEFAAMYIAYLGYREKKYTEPSSPSPKQAFADLCSTYTRLSENQTCETYSNSSSRLLSKRGKIEVLTNHVSETLEVESLQVEGLEGEGNEENIASPPAILSLPEDSIYRKLSACIPLFGIASSIYHERSLEAKLKQEQDPQNQLQLHKVLRDYKIAAVVRDILSIALLVSTLALTLLTGTVCLIGVGVLAYHSYKLYQHN